MEKQKKTIKINLKTAIIISILVISILAIIGFYSYKLIIKKHSNNETNNKELTNIDVENNRYDTINYIGEDGTIGVTIYKEEQETDFEIVNKYGEIIRNFKGFKHCKNINNNQILICKDTLYKLIDNNGNIVLESISDSNPETIICITNNKVEYIAFSKNEKLKIINLKTKQIVSNYEYNEVDFRLTINGLIKVKKDGKWGFIDENGKIIINLEYENLADGFSEGIIAAKKDGKCGCIDKNGNIVINFEYDRIGNFSEGIVSAKKGDKIGFLNKQGNRIIDFQYEYIYDKEYFENDFSFFLDMPQFREGVALVYKDGWGFFIDKLGNKAIDFETDFYTVDNYFYNGILVAGKNGKQGIFDKNGKIIVDFIYEEIGNYYEFKLLPAKLNGKWGVIDENGNVVINFEYDNSPYLDHNYNNLIDKYIIVEKNGKSGCIDKNGKVLVDFKYDGLLETSNNNLLAAIYNRKLGIINSAGETIIDFKYDEFSFFNHTDHIMNTNLGLRTNILGAYRRGENWDILDIDGNIIWTYKCKSK